MLSFLMLRYNFLIHVLLCCVMLCHVMSCYVILCYVKLHHVTSCHVISCHVMLFYVMLCYGIFVMCKVICRLKLFQHKMSNCTASQGHFPLKLCERQYSQFRIVIQYFSQYRNPFTSITVLNSSDLIWQHIKAFKIINSTSKIF